METAMARPPLRLALTALLLASFATTTEAATIDFETIPGGAPSEGLVISDQFQALLGVRFELEGGGHPVLAGTGPAMTAFGGGTANLPDTPADAAAPLVGGWFLTDDGSVAAPPLPLIVRFDNGVATASGILIDVDGWGAGLFYEAFRIEARDGNDAVLETLDLIGTIAGDGQAAPWSFNRAFEDILSIRISYFGNKTTGIGLAFDAFSVSSVPEPGTIALVGIGLAVLGARRR
jgi:hypothetical protein